jgi:hypothetical protein
MTFKIKTLIGLYVFTILLFSGASRAEANTSLFSSLTNNPIAELDLINSTGTVFEVNGYLYFEAQNQEALLVHSSNFDFFEHLKLPVQVNADSVIVSMHGGFVGSPRTIRFMTNSIKRNNLL